MSETDVFKLECDKFNEPSFNAAAYVDYMLASDDKTLHPEMRIKEGRVVLVSGWLPELIRDGEGQNNCNFEAFEAELRKRKLVRKWTISRMIDEDTGEDTLFAAYQPVR